MSDDTMRNDPIRPDVPNEDVPTQGVGATPPDPGPVPPSAPTAPVDDPAASAQPAPYREPVAASDDGPRPAEPTVEVSTAVIDPAGLSASEAAAAKRAETAAAVAIVAAVAESKARAAAEAAAHAEPEVVEAPARPGRIRALRAFGAMLVRGLLVLALFLGGYALGQAAFQSNQTEAPLPIIDPSTEGAQPPAVVREFIGALASGNNDVLRSSLGAEPHARLVTEFRVRGIQTISNVATLSTHVDGTRTATGIVLLGTTTAGTELFINLVVLTDGNVIEGFR